LEIAESFFWSAFTDAYIELVKARARGDDESTAFERFSAVNALRIGLSVLLRLFAPFLPFITEEVWSWVFALETGHSSIHTATWPTASELESIPQPAHPRSFEAATKALRAIHKLKTLSKVSVSARMERLEIVGDGELIAALRRVLADLKNAARVDTVQVSSEDTTDAGALEVRAAQLAQRQS
jgi:valyl-tRNA synthetase